MTMTIAKILGALAIGVVCGIIPTALAITLRKDYRYAMGSMIACIACGLLFGMHAAGPCAIAITIAIVAEKLKKTQ